MNRVHPYHDAATFLKGKRHIALTFHDTTFECVVESYSFKVSRGSVGGMVASMGNELR